VPDETDAESNPGNPAGHLRNQRAGLTVAVAEPPPNKCPFPFCVGTGLFAYQQSTKPKTIIMKTFNPPADLVRRSLSRMLAATLLITGMLALLSATAMFAFHIIVPIAALFVLGILIARGVLHSLTGKIESLGSDLRRFSMETLSEGVKMAGQFARSSATVFHPNPEAARENGSEQR
jgi:hypothetical protein